MNLKNLYLKSILQNTKLSPENEDDLSVPDLQNLFTSLINGHYFLVLKHPIFADNILTSTKVIDITKSYIEKEDIEAFQFVDDIVSQFFENLSVVCETNEITSTYMYLLAVLFLQMFVTSNFSGPKLPFQSSDSELGFLQLLFRKDNNRILSKVQNDCLQLLNINGFAPYHLSESPLLLVLSLRIFEKLHHCDISLLHPSISSISTEEIVQKSMDVVLGHKTLPDYIMGSISWFRARACQVQQALLAEISPVLTSLSLNLLSNNTLHSLIDQENSSSQINQSLLITYYLEVANVALSGELESQTLDAIMNANRVSGLSLVLTGCKAKFTQYQEKSTAALTVLAKSNDALLRAEQTEKTFNPLDVKLNDDLFLDRPKYDSIGDDELLQETEEYNEEENYIKRIKVDFSQSSESGLSQTFTEQLLPIAKKESDIPAALCKLDPNNQPNLANLDHVQLLLRMQTILNNTPSGNVLVNEELIAVIQRTLFSEVNSVNWLIYARALWYRSLLETARSRTVERGVLQLYSLVEELGVNSEKTARLFPKTEDEVNFSINFRDSTDIQLTLTNSVRLRYIYQLPLMPKWAMDSKLAEKLMELGSLKSALEIYERLEKWTDAALCYASTGDESRGIELIKRALDCNPRDARSWSVLGDITGDPDMWLKAWEIGKYANAKRSLAKYYYNPPKSSGLSRQLMTAIEHMYDCLSANPLNFQNWFFYGCMGLEAEKVDLAAEAFTRCIALDDTNSYAWSNLASALIKLNKLPEAFNALKKSVNSGDSAKKSWRIWENYLIVAAKLNKWDDVLYASVVLLNRKKDLDHNESSIDLPVVEKLVELLVSEPFEEVKSQRYFQKTCVNFICNMIPSVLHHDARIWRIIAKVDLWRKKPWLALEDYEKAYRAASNNPELQSNENVWNSAVDACIELISAYENFGELEGRHGAGDIICKDWRFKAKSAIRSLISKGKTSWEYTESYERLLELKCEVIKM